MEWIDDVRCTDPKGRRDAGSTWMSSYASMMSGLQQLVEFGLFRDPHPGNIPAIRRREDRVRGFRNVRCERTTNAGDAVVHAVNEDYDSMAGDFPTRVLSPGHGRHPYRPRFGEHLARRRTRRCSSASNRHRPAFNELVYQYPIRIPERFSLVIRSLLTQEGICMSLSPDFRFLRLRTRTCMRLLTDRDASCAASGAGALQRPGRVVPVAAPGEPRGARARIRRRPHLKHRRGRRAAAVTDETLRRQPPTAHRDNRLRVDEVARVAALLGDDVQIDRLASQSLAGGPAFLRKMALSWSDKVLSN